MKSLSETLRYQNDDLVRRIQRALNTSKAKAQFVYTDMLRWLWLCAKLRDERQSNTWLNANLRSMRMPSTWLPIDLAWHEFILCTSEYTLFCDQYLDGYIHHKPAEIDAGLISKGSAFNQEYLEIFYSFVSNHIGLARLKKWINEYSLWSKRILKRIR